MGKRSGKNQSIVLRRQALGVVLIIATLYILCKSLHVETRFISATLSIVGLIVILVKFFGFTFSKVVVAFVILSNFVYAYKVIEIAKFGGQEPTSLTVAFFSFTTVQLWNTARIRTVKEKTKQAEIQYGGDDICG